jgi:glycine/D-amino acid oxidase-like deaminating enzyme
MVEMYPKNAPEKLIPFLGKGSVRKLEVPVLIAGGGIGGSALFRYFAEAGMKPVLVNHDRGASWRNIAGGRPVFSVPELSDIAEHNLQIFKELQAMKNIDYKPIRYISFAHDDSTYKALEASMAWSDADMVDSKDFRQEISPLFNGDLKTYQAALITRNCWQASPGKSIDLIRRIGIESGGIVQEDCKILDVSKQGNKYIVLTYNHEREYVEYETPLFVNALGPTAGKFAKKLGVETGIYPVKHQAFITRRLPMMGKGGDTLDMLIDRRKYKGFSAVYGQQLKETGQIIGCASPAVDPMETDKNLKISSQEFLEIVSEIFVDWIPQLSSVGFQAVWSGYYVEPRYIIDPSLGLFIGLRGHGFMLSQYLAKMYVDKLNGHPVPEYFERLRLNGEGISETAFK